MKKKLTTAVLACSMAAVLSACSGTAATGASGSTVASAASQAASGASSQTQSEPASESTASGASDAAGAENPRGDYAKLLAQQEADGKIYTSLFTGRWDNQQVEEMSGNYSVYVPDNFEYCSPAVMILTPNGVSASDWLDGEDGRAWTAVADQAGIALVVAEPDGGAWNTDLASNKRDDQTYLHSVYGKLTSKADANPSAFDLNERALYVVGYDEGATAANELSMKWPALFAGVVAIGGEDVPEDAVSTLGDAISFPFAEATESGSEENNIPNKEIPARVWEIAKEGSLDGNIAYWTSADKLDSAKETANEYAAVLTNEKDGEALPEQIWYSDYADTLSAEDIYNEFLSKAQRFVGDPGGYLEWTVEHTNDGEHGFFLNEEKVGNYTRRWLTYVPESYDGSEDVPLVVAMHGYSSSIFAFTGDSRWQKVADKYNLIIAFPQAYVNDGAYSGDSCIPVPIWNNYSPVYCNTTKDAPDDVAFIKHIVDQTKEDYSIDATRVYATGHSNGSAMTWMLAQDAPEYFTAVAPIGFNWGSYPGYDLSGGTVDYSVAEKNSYLLPVWCMTGEFDVGDAGDYSSDNKNSKTVSYWKAYDGTSDEDTVTTETRSTRAPHDYETHTFTGEDNAPLVRYTVISNNCHSYMEDIAFMVWEEFFRDYTRDADGTLYYDGEEIQKTAASSAN